MRTKKSDIYGTSRKYINILHKERLQTYHKKAESSIAAFRLQSSGFVAFSISGIRKPSVKCDQIQSADTYECVNDP